MAAPDGSNVFGTAGSGSESDGSNVFGSTPAVAAVKQPQHHGTLGGNLLHEVGGIVTGLATAPVHFAENLATHPVATFEHAPHDIAKYAKGTVASEVKTWGPFLGYHYHFAKYLAALATGDHATAVREHALAEKDNRTFNEQFHAAPAQPLIDLAALATGGAGRIAALSHVPEDATLGQLAKTAALKGERIGTPKVLHVNVGEKTVPVRTLPRSAYRAARMEFTHKLLTKETGPLSKLVPPERSVIGQQARAARALKNDAAQVRMKLLASGEGHAYMRAFGKLSKWERAAVQMIAKLSTPENLDLHIANLRRNGADAVAHAEQKLAEAKTPAAKAAAKKLLNVVTTGRKTMEQQAALLSHPEFRKAFDHPNGKVLDAVEAARALSAKREEILQSLGEPVDAMRESVFKHIRVTHGATFDEEGALTGGGSVAEHQAAIDAAGRPHPFYMPDQLDEGNALTKARKGSNAGQPTGLLPAASDVRTWQGVLFKSGQLALHPDVLSPSFLRAVTRAYGHDLHEHVKEIATPVEKGVGLPHGYRWVREKRGEQIPFTESHGAEHLTNTGREFPEISSELGDLFSDEAHLPEDQIAHDPAGRRLAVPQKFADELRVQQRAPRGAISKFWNESTQVWRALLLNIRVPWLINNIVGNHVLAAVRFAGVPGLKAYVGALEEVKGVKAVRKLLRMPETRAHLSDETLREIFPEQSRAGTGIGSQMPTNASSHLPVMLQRGLKPFRLGFSVLPKVDAATEGFLRRWGVETNLRRSPEFNRILKAMPRQTRDFNEAAKRFASDPASAHAVSREVNDALGNFHSLSYAEQNQIRALVPFYAWYREITRIALKLPLDEPLRASILLRLGQTAGTQPGLPTYLQGDVPVGHLDAKGRQTLLALRSMNPYTTPVDLARAISIMVHPSKAGAEQAQGLFNPFIGLFASTIDAASKGDPGSKSVLSAFYTDFLKTLPESQIGFNKKSKLYPGRTRTDLAEQFLGSPVRKVNPAVAQQYASEGQ